MGADLEKKMEELLGHLESSTLQTSLKELSVASGVQATEIKNMKEGMASGRERAIAHQKNVIKKIEGVQASLTLKADVEVTEARFMKVEKKVNWLVIVFVSGCVSGGGSVGGLLATTEGRKLVGKAISAWFGG